MTANRFTGQTVIVTGGARGMGASHVRGLIAEGASVVIADVSDNDGQALADELGDRAVFQHLDVSDQTQWAHTVAAAEEIFGPVYFSSPPPRRASPPDPSSSQTEETFSAP